MSPANDTDALLEHAGFVRGLARALLCDAAVAEDVAQETLLAAIQARGPAAASPRPGSLRAWLAGVVKNLARQARRTQTRRARHEHDVAGLGAAPSTADAVAQLDLIEHLVAAVRALDEPYRTVILARFFEGRSAGEIALAQSVPLETVRTRLKRAIERLRATLDRDAANGPRSDRSWSALLLPFTGLPPDLVAHAGAAIAAGAATSTIGAIVMTTKGKLLAAAAVALVAAITFVLQERESRPRRGVGAAARAAAATSRTALEVELQEEARRELDAAVADDPLATFVLRGTLRSGATEQPWPYGAVRARLWTGYDDTGEPSVDVLLHADADGAFQWKLRPPEGDVWVRLAAEPPRCFGSSDERLLVEGAPAPDDITLSVYPYDRRVVGHVLDALGRPAPGAKVGHLGGRATDCDEAGAYSIEVCTGFRQQSLDAWAPGCARSRIYFELDVDDDPVVQDFRLAPGATLVGVVTDESGRAVEGAAVRGSPQTALTDSEGRYVLDLLAPDVEEDVDAFLAGHVRVAKKLTLKAGENHCDFTLPRGVRVSGGVQLPDGSAARGARICLGFSRYAFDRLDAIAQARGEFTFPAVAPGEHRMVVERPGSAMLEQTLSVPPGAEEVSGLVLRLSAEHFLAGRVLDEEGAPIAGALVRLQSNGEETGATPRTDRDGRFRISGLPAGPLEAWIDRGGYVRLLEKSVALDRADAEFVLKPAGRAAGRVVDGVTGAPISRFRIRFVGPINPRGSIANYSWYARGRGFHSEDGTWDTGEEEIEPGLRLGIEASAEGYAPTLVDDVEFTVEPDPDDVVLQLYRGSSLEGVVLDDGDRHPIAGATVKLVTDATPLADGYGRPTNTPRPVATTDCNGRFRLEGLRQGSSKLFVEHPDYSGTWSSSFEAPESGAAPPQEVRVAAGGVIEATVLDGRGHPRADAMVMLTLLGSSRTGGDQRTTTADARGRFRVTGLRPGRWQVYVTSPSSGEWPQPVARFVELGKGEHASFTMPRGSTILSGRLLSEDALPASMKVEASRFEPGDAERIIEVEVDGKLVRGRSSAPLLLDRVQTFATSDVYELAGLDAGPWTITAEAWDRERKLRWSARAEITVVEGVDPMLDLRVVTTSTSR